MQLELNCPLIVIDAETTGLHRKIDRIVQIGLVKYYPKAEQLDGAPVSRPLPTEWSTYVNPTIPIPPESTETHHITDEMVKGAPTFAELAPKLAAGFKGCDYSGFNVWFDLGILEEEFKRVTPHKVLNGRVVDTMSIYRKYFPRTLSDAYREYLGKELDGAHDALIDARAAADILEAQLTRYPELSRSVEQLHREFNEAPQGNNVDPEGKLYWRYREATVNFGTHAGKKLREVPKGWLKWVLENDFSDNFKDIIRNAMVGKFPEKQV